MLLRVKFKNLMISCIFTEHMYLVSNESICCPGCCLVSDLDDHSCKLVCSKHKWDQLHQLCKEMEATYFVLSQNTNLGS